ncbi:MAG TPA: hypothetical protein VN018_04450 [Brevundimonas sp.]|nr:hypothetical protein [Brevundimonas sp.]
MLYSVGALGIAGLGWLSHEFGRQRPGGMIFVGAMGLLGLAGFFYGLLPLQLRADEQGLHWRQAGPRRSLRWSEIEGFGVWRDRSIDAWNDHPVVRFTRRQQSRPPARLMIRLTPEARRARKTQTLYQQSGYDIGLMLPVRMTLTMLEAELERRLAAARGGNFKNI